MDSRPRFFKLLTSITICVTCVFFVIRKSRLCEIHRVIDRNAKVKSNRNESPLSRRRSQSRVLESIHDSLDEKERSSSECWLTTDTIVTRKSQLPKWDKWIRYLYRGTLALNLLEALKYSLICLVDMGALPNHKYLDCYLLGRIALNSRVVGLMKYAALCVFYFHIFYLAQLLYFKPKFRLHCLEFLLMSPKDVNKFKLHSDIMRLERDLELLLAASEEQSRISRREELQELNLIRGHYDQSNVFSGKRHNTRLTQRANSAHRSQANGSGLYYEYSPLLSYRNTFIYDTRADSYSELLQDSPLRNYACDIRPNRTMRAWRLLAKILTYQVMSVAITFLVVALPYIRIAMPLAITKPGMEATYHTCFEWISQQEDRSRWKYFYDVPRNFSIGPGNRMFFLPLTEDLIDFNLFHIVRITLEILENFFFQVELFVGMFVFSVIAMLTIFDVCYYSRHIEKRLKQIASDYNEVGEYLTNESLQTPLLPLSNLTSLSGGEIFIERRKSNSTIALDLDGVLEARNEHDRASQHMQGAILHDFKRQIADVQAQVVDLFNIIRDYNYYTVFFVSFIMIIWYTYSAICSSWLFVPSQFSESATIESYLIQTVATTIMITIVGSYATAKIVCAHLYRWIASIASIQEIDEVSRERWLVILKHYKPVPLYCFSIFRTTELSWMFALKLIAWLFSALLITSTFFVYLK